MLLSELLSADVVLLNDVVVTVRGKDVLRRSSIEQAISLLEKKRTGTGDVKKRDRFRCHASSAPANRCASGSVPGSCVYTK